MHKRIPYTDPLLELLDCIEDAVQLLAFGYEAACKDELRRARGLLDGALDGWRDAEALIAREWLRQAAERTARGSRGDCAGALWRARRAVRRHWLRGLGVGWDPYDVPLTAPGTRALQAARSNGAARES
jgi:hypothetical protein